MNSPGESGRQRIALWLEYDGSDYSGWQLQRGSQVASVQGVMEAAIGFVADHPVRAHCAGRTDAGVHATCQLIHFESRNYREPIAWLRGCNANLPPSVVVRAAQVVPAAFHARFSALARRYRYLIYDHPVRPALGARYLTWVRQPLDASRMHEAAQALPGEQDFSAFRAAACQSSTPMRHVDFVDVSRRGSVVCIDIQANAFLHHMVRNIAGALIVVGKGYKDPAWLEELLAQRDRKLAPDTAPAGGLYLVGVKYPEEFRLESPPPGPMCLGFDS